MVLSRQLEHVTGIIDNTEKYYRDLQRRTIYKLYTEFGFTPTELARMANTSRSQIHRIIAKGK